MKLHGIVVLVALITILIPGCIVNQPAHVQVTQPANITPAATVPATLVPTRVSPDISLISPVLPPGQGNETNVSGNDLFFLAPLKPKYYEGDVITVHGTTILAPGDQLLVEVVSSSFGPTTKSSRQWFTGVSGVVSVHQGQAGGPNTWTFSFPTDGFAWDTYIVTVSGLTVKVQDSTTFELLPRM